MTPEKLRELRIACGLTQKQPGIACGLEGKVAEDCVYQWEHGIREIPPTKYRKLAEALGITLDDVVP